MVPFSAVVCASPTSGRALQGGTRAPGEDSGGNRTQPSLVGHRHCGPDCRALPPTLLEGSVCGCSVPMPTAGCRSMTATSRQSGPGLDFRGDEGRFVSLGGLCSSGAGTASRPGHAASCELLGILSPSHSWMEVGRLQGHSRTFRSRENQGPGSLSHPKSLLCRSTGLACFLFSHCPSGPDPCLLPVYVCVCTQTHTCAHALSPLVASPAPAQQAWAIQPLEPDTDCWSLVPEHQGNVSGSELTAEEKTSHYFYNHTLSFQMNTQ